jgi:hypothetical protein
MFVSKARSLPLNGAPERYITGVSKALPTNIRLGWKGMPRTNTLAYYKNSQITTVKMFYNIGPW